jgi:hypothetical protein
MSACFGEKRRKRMEENVQLQYRATPQKAGATELINFMGGYRAGNWEEMPGFRG